MLSKNREILSVSQKKIRPLLDLAAVAPSAKLLQSYANKKQPFTQDQRMPLTDYFHILQELSVVLHDENVHLSSRHLFPGTIEYIMSNICYADDLEAAMRLIAKSYNVLHGGPYNRVVVSDGYLHYIIDDTQFPYAMENKEYIHFRLESVLLHLHGLLGYSTSQNLLPLLRRVYTKRQRSTRLSDLMSYWNVPIRYQCGHYALIYDLSAATLPVTVDPENKPSAGDIYSHVIEMVDQSQSSKSKYKTIASRICLEVERGNLNQSKVAKHLGFSVATLKRRLTEENTTFRHLVILSLNNKAKLLMSQGVHINDVAAELGYSDFRSFNRAFKNWNAVTPASYLKTLNLKTFTH